MSSNKDLNPPPPVVSQNMLKRYSSIDPLGSSGFPQATNPSAKGESLYSSDFVHGSNAQSSRILKTNINNNQKKLNERDIQLQRIYNPVGRTGSAPKLSNCI